MHRPTPAAPRVFKSERRVISDSFACWGAPRKTRVIRTRKSGQLRATPISRNASDSSPGTDAGQGSGSRVPYLASDPKRCLGAEGRKKFRRGRRRCYSTTLPPAAKTLAVLKLDPPTCKGEPHAQHVTATIPRHHGSGGRFARPALIGLERPKIAPFGLGVIGVGWYGMVDVRAALKVGGVEIAAVCDVDRDHLKQSADELEKLQGKRPQTFKLYEELLDLKGLDAVIIATPPHWHALQFIAALQHGLDVYCEKPLAYDIREGQAMVEAAAKHGRIVEIGFQRR